MLKGRLGLDTARIPQVDRHGLLWLDRGRLFVDGGTVRFVTTGCDGLPAGEYAIPYQMVSSILLGPGTSVTHDALRILARHGTGLVAVAEGGVRLYASLPAGPDRSKRARAQAEAWADREIRRRDVIRRMYAWRLGELLPSSDIEVLRGVEGARMRETYALLAAQFGIRWDGRRYDRDAPEEDDLPNRAINHAATAMYALAGVAVAVTGTIPQLGFVHEDSGQAFALDIADLYRSTITVPVAFAAASAAEPESSLERRVRQRIADRCRKDQVIESMIDRIEALFDADNDSHHA